MSASSGITVKDVKAQDFVAAYAKYLKRSGKVDLPKWVDIVKTGAYKELAPYDPDWYFTRTASIARQIYLNQNLGVGNLKKHYGGASRRGVRPSHQAQASGAVIRACFHTLEALKVVEVDAKSGGRKITQTGQRDLDRIAGHVQKAKAKAAEAPKA